jgi:hypothetical protein
MDPVPVADVEEPAVVGLDRRVHGRLLECPLAVNVRY